MKRTPLKNAVASTSRSPSTDTTEADLSKQNAVVRSSYHRTRALSAVITLVTLQVTTAFAAQTYLITDLGTLSGATSASAAAINNNNQVVGNSGLDAFLLSNGTMRDLGNLGGAISAAALNGVGDVVGSASTSSGTHPFLFLFQNGKLSDLGIPSGFNSGAATGVNGSDQVVGQLNGGSRRQAFSRAFLWQNGRGFTDLGTLGGRSASATGINNSGLIVGSWVRAQSNGGESGPSNVASVVAP